MSKNITEMVSKLNEGIWLLKIVLHGNLISGISKSFMAIQRGYVDTIYEKQHKKLFDEQIKSCEYNVE